VGGLARRAGTSLAPEPFLTPATRIHFLDEQRRHRRSSVALAGLVVAALAVSGIPLSILISPLLVALVAIPVSLADTLVDVPPGLADWLDRAFNLLPTMWAAVRRSDVDLPWDWLLGLFVVPGLVVTLLLWALVRVTFRRIGVGGVLRRMQTRLPRKDDTAEQRVANLVEEVAVAAGVRPPRVLLVDTPAANVAAAGLRIEDATVVVTRGFVDRLPRDSQQAVVAHVMASVGNGDLTLAAEMLTLLQTWGLVTLALESPFLSTSRARLGLIGRSAWRTLRREADASTGELAVDTLLAGAGYEHGMDSEELEIVPNLHPLMLVVVYLPLLCTVGLLAIFAKTVVWTTALLLGPFVALLWRARRKLADATAVQLTRQPDALAHALRTLTGLDMKVPGAVAVHFLFPVWDPRVDADHTRTDVTSVLLHLQLPLDPRLRRLERLGAGAEHRPDAPAKPIGEAAREIGAAVGWLLVALAFLGLVLAASAVAAAGVLYALGRLLNLLPD
jgi:Zn-dependent protease with chaperone function